MRPPITLTDLNQFTVLASEVTGDRTLLTGRLSKPGRPSVGERVYLFIDLYDDVPGQLIEVDPDAQTAVLTLFSRNPHPSVTVGSSFPICNDYWSERIPLVLDANLNWKRTPFIAPNAFEQVSPGGGRMWRATEPGDEGHTDGRIVPGGWDHEHCEICRRHIGVQGDPEGYVTENDQWVCTSCHSRFVDRRDLSFVLEGADDETDAFEEEPFQHVSRLIDEYDLAGIREFLRSRWRVDVRNRYGWTPLMIAATRGQRSLVTLLLDEGADVNAVAEAHGYTTLALAAQKGHMAIVQMLLDAGASVRVPENFFNGSLLCYVKTGPGGDNSRIVDLLSRAGAT